MQPFIVIIVTSTSPVYMGRCAAEKQWFSTLNIRPAIKEQLIIASCKRWFDEEQTFMGPKSPFHNLHTQLISCGLSGQNGHRKSATKSTVLREEHPYRPPIHCIECDRGATHVQTTCTVHKSSIYSMDIWEGQIAQAGTVYILQNTVCFIMAVTANSKSPLSAPQLPQSRHSASPLLCSVKIQLPVAAFQATL